MSHPVDTWGRTGPPRVEHPRDHGTSPGAKAAFEYEALLEMEPPDVPPVPFPFGMLDDEYRAHVQERAAYEQQEAALADLAGPYLLKEAEDNAGAASPIGQAIIDEAHRLGVPVEVLSDSEYEERFPGTAGVNSDGTVYLPASGLLDGSHSVLVHEYIHAILGEQLSPDNSPEKRIAATRDTFERLGLDPQDGEWIARATEGWENGVAAEHVATYYLGAEMARQEQGLPPMADGERQTFIDNIAMREMALSIQRDFEDAPGGLMGDMALLSAWHSWPQGRENPPSGNNISERAADVRRMLDEYADEGRLVPQGKIGKGGD